MSVPNSVCDNRRPLASARPLSTFRTGVIGPRGSCLKVALNPTANLLLFVSVLSTRPLPNGSLPGPLILRRRNARFSLSVLGTFLFLGP
jgi:hypothetical protein